MQESNITIQKIESFSLHYKQRNGFYVIDFLAKLNIF